jgi:hypothetical protein
MLAFPARRFLFTRTITIEKMVAIPEMRRRPNFLATTRGLQELLVIIVASSHASSQRV